ncbi:hypothetical protein FGO68_gene12010 [Halteria grandinella]|uniref:Palmitoyltransferase n=1 Tax=Halteria grandinella TaxID=5974 RepID=A0A8J8T2V3_HALGN|nr:hypothetical protein FGO68_gene12010 [Halteria grandinella]
MSETKDSSFYSKKNSERPLVTRNLSDISENTPYKQQRVEPSPSVTSQKSLSEKLLDIDSIHKNSSRHVLRPAIPIEQAPAPAPQIRKSSGIPNFMTYQGKTKHCCKGRCLFGSQPKWSTFSFFMFNLPALLTYVFVSPQYAGEEISWALTLGLLILQLFTTICFFLTAWSNPGIIPRSSLRVRTQLNLESTRGKQVGSRVHQLIVGASGLHMTRLKYCHTCLVLRPERAFHCHFCGNCVHRFDHHCQWLGSCIGGRNYKQFFSFLIGVMCLQWACILYNLSHLIITMVQTHVEFGGVFNALWLELKATPFLVINSFLSLIVGGFVTHLFGYHLVVICWQGLSTYESKKDHFISYLMGNPYQLGKRRCYLLCRRRVTKMYSLREDEPIKVLDSNQRLSLKVISKETDIRKVLSMHKESTSKAFPEFEDLVKETKLQGVTKHIIRVESSVKIKRIESNASSGDHSSGDNSRNHVINTERSEVSNSGMFDLNSSQFINMHRINLTTIGQSEDVDAESTVINANRETTVDEHQSTDVRRLISSSSNSSVVY